jgi:hypothetical protein
MNAAMSPPTKSLSTTLTSHHCVRIFSISFCDAARLVKDKASTVGRVRNAAILPREKNRENIADILDAIACAFVENEYICYQ